MKFYEYGNPENSVILLIPGTCCHWTIFHKVIPLLQKYFFVSIVSFDGFDETENTVYSSMEEETEKIEAYVNRKFRGKICCTYGCSLGGSFAAYLVKRGNIHIDHAIIGSSDLDEGNGLLAILKSKMLAKIFYRMLKRDEVPGWLRRYIAKTCKNDSQRAAHFDEVLRMFIPAPYKSVLRKKSIYNQYYSDLVTDIGNHINVKDTTIHVFYALGMGEKYRKRYYLHFADPDIRDQNFNHETFFFCHPKEWTEEVLDCCDIKSINSNLKVKYNK